jgi:hypothetical protein
MNRVKLSIKGQSRPVEKVEGFDDLEFSLSQVGQVVSLRVRKNGGYNWAVVCISAEDGLLHICNAISEDIGLKRTKTCSIKLGSNY